MSIRRAPWGQYQEQDQSDQIYPGAERDEYRIEEAGGEYTAVKMGLGALIQH